MITIIDWLNQNSGGITAIATLILVFITGGYVHLTNQILKASNTPQIMMFLRRYDHYNALCVQNIGNGYAKDINFTVNSDDPEHMLKDREPYKSGLPYLGAGQKLETNLFTNTSLDRLLLGLEQKRLRTRPIDICGTYTDATGKTVKDIHLLTLNNISPPTLIFETEDSQTEDNQTYDISPIDDVAQALQSINKGIN